jgi:hypothetical protein
VLPLSIVKAPLLGPVIDAPWTVRVFPTVTVPSSACV